MKPFTHIGVIKGNDNRTPKDYQYEVKLRETKLFWINEKNVKYKKRNGNPMGIWPVVRLDLNSIKEIK